jgi:hypothetical protein
MGQTDTRVRRRRAQDGLADVDDDVFCRLMLRMGVAVGMVGIALIHFLDLFSKFKETPYLGVVYLVLIAASLGVAARLLRSGQRSSFLVAAALAAAAFVAYAVSRTLGLPAASDDIGHWTEPLGLASLFVEALVVVSSGYALALDAAHADRVARHSSAG